MSWTTELKPLCTRTLQKDLDLSSFVKIWGWERDMPNGFARIDFFTSRTNGSIWNSRRKNSLVRLTWHCLNPCSSSFNNLNAESAFLHILQLILSIIARSTSSFSSVDTTVHWILYAKYIQYMQRTASFHQHEESDEFSCFYLFHSLRKGILRKDDFASSILHSLKMVSENASFNLQAWLWSCEWWICIKIDWELWFGRLFVIMKRRTKIVYLG